MSKLRRYFAPNQTCFITSVTADRTPLLITYIDCLFQAASLAFSKSKTRPIAWVVLPDHFHAVLSCPDGDVTKVMQRLKLSFSLRLKSKVGTVGPVWQHRYWDHIIRDANEIEDFINYIHYNPVKHGYVDSPEDWRFSSYRQFVRMGCYGEGLVPAEVDIELTGE